MNERQVRVLWVLGIFCILCIWLAASNSGAYWDNPINRRAYYEMKANFTLTFVAAIVPSIIFASLAIFTLRDKK